MRGKIIALLSVFAFGLLMASAAAPTAAADQPEKVDVFVCPVLNETVGMHNPNTFPIYGGDYSILPGKAGQHGPGDIFISVPINATNGNGAGSPGAWHAAPGDDNYSPLWNVSD